VKSPEAQAERARCLAIAMECLEHGHFGEPCKEFSDGYSLACQEIAGEIQREDAGGQTRPR
jgi:hypothetical protein